MAQTDIQHCTLQLLHCFILHCTEYMCSQVAHLCNKQYVCSLCSPISFDLTHHSECTGLEI